MAVRSRLLAATTVVPVNTFHDVYVVPSDRTAIVRRWSVVNRTALARRTLVLVRSAGATCGIAAHAGLQPDGSIAEPDSGLVLGPGDAFVVWHANADTNTNFAVVLSGALLEGAPV